MKNLKDGKRKCPKCGRVGGLEMWSAAMLKDGNRFYGQCKQCRKPICAKYRKKHRRRVLRANVRYRRTPKGLMKRIFDGQIFHCKRKKGNALKLLYSRIEFEAWMMNNDKFHELYTKWVDSGFRLALKPTVDRTNPNGNYEFGNITVMTVAENMEKGYKQDRPKIIQWRYANGL